MPQRHADAIRIRVEELLAAQISGHAPSADTSRWLRGIDDDLHARLAAVDLVTPRQTTTLGAWLDTLLAERRDELKPESLRKLSQTRAKLIGRPETPERSAVKGYFDPARPLRTITPAEAAAWRRWLKDLGLSEAAVRTHAGNAKTLLAPAVARKLIDENPFSALASGPTAAENRVFVTAETIDAMIAEAPSREWALLLGLARYGGLRVPSETHSLTWADVDWQRCRLTVRSPKTARYSGGAQRVIPIVPRLMALVMARFEECGPEDRHLVTVRGQGRTMKAVRAMAARAGVDLWPKLWQALRASCETELAATYPHHVTARWLGHSTMVAARHYLTVPDETYDRAAGLAPRTSDGAEPAALIHALMKPSESARNDRKQKTTAGGADGRNSAAFRDFPDSSVSPCQQKTWRRGESNPRYNLKIAY